jgi:hypothetical protein
MLATAMAAIQRPMSREEAGITRKAIPPGPAKLVAAMVRRGLRKDCLLAAAQLAIALDERPSV